MLLRYERSYSSQQVDALVGGESSKFVAVEESALVLAYGGAVAAVGAFAFAGLYDIDGLVAEAFGYVFGGAFLVAT